jgi:inhibitor of KinA
VRVPRGAVGIAGSQTGVHPVEAPSGWQLIGRTPVRPFDSARAEPFLMKPGDSVHFYQVDRPEFDRMERASQAAV